MVSVKFENGIATVSVEIDAAEIVATREALLVAQSKIDAALTAGQKTDAEVQAEVDAEVAKRIAARPEVTGLDEHVAAIVAAQEAEREKNGGDRENKSDEAGNGGTVAPADNNAG